MKVYAVTYDLHKKTSDDYENLFDELKNSSAWWHYLDSFWLIKTSESAEQIYNRLRPKIKDEDNLFVIEVGKDRQGWIPKKAWDWIKNNVG